MRAALLLAVGLVAGPPVLAATSLLAADAPGGAEPAPPERPLVPATAGRAPPPPARPPPDPEAGAMPAAILAIALVAIGAVVLLRPGRGA